MNGNCFYVWRCRSVFVNTNYKRINRKNTRNMLHSSDSILGMEKKYNILLINVKCHTQLSHNTCPDKRLAKRMFNSYEKSNLSTINACNLLWHNLKSWFKKKKEIEPRWDIMEGNVFIYTQICSKEIWKTK